jgi:membrane protease YdiL (CAAX protease family)
VSRHPADPARASGLAERSRGFGALGLTAIVVILAAGFAGMIVSALLVLAWAHLSETPLAELGLAAPRSWPTTVLAGVALGVALKVAVKAIVMPLLGAPAINATYHYLAGNTAALPGIVITVVVSGGIAEEIVFRGYLFERLGKLLGRGKAALAATILLSSALFALAHYADQRLPGVEQATVTGLAFGATYAWRRELGLVMVAHATYDLVAIALIYWNLEVPLAHLLFR